MGIIHVIHTPRNNSIRPVKNTSSFNSLRRAVSTFVTTMSAGSISFQRRLHQHGVGGLVGLEFGVGHGGGCAVWARKFGVVASVVVMREAYRSGGVVVAATSTAKLREMYSAC